MGSNRSVIGSIEFSFFVSRLHIVMKGYRMVPFNLKDCWPLLELLGKIDNCSLARARRMFATARMLGFSYN